MSRGEVGRVHSVQTMGTLDGPGVRFVVFLQGCNLRCKCCHNPDTWEMQGGTKYTAEELCCKAARYREYFGNDGGITVSGGEPLLQADFVRELFQLCHKEKIHTCLDTSGCLLNEEIKLLLKETDRVLLDIKYTSDAQYLENVGCSLSAPLDFLAYLDEQKIPTTLRQVIISGINDTEDNIVQLKDIAAKHACVDKIELLPFKKICQTKYDTMGLVFPFGHLPETTSETTQKLSLMLGGYIR